MLSVYLGYVTDSGLEQQVYPKDAPKFQALLSVGTAIDGFTISGPKDKPGTD